MLLLTPHPLLDLLVSLCALATIGVLWRLCQKWRRRFLHAEEMARELALGQEDLRAQLEASNTVMHVQSHALYDQACQLHGKAAVDRAMRASHERGSN
jgi:hypothetical protein